MPSSRRCSNSVTPREGGSRPALLTRRLLPLLCLAGCQYAANPLVGFPQFVGDTHTFRTNPNLPPDHNDNTLRARGQDVAGQALLPESGNVWPGPPPPIPSLADIQKQQNLNEQLPPANVPQIIPPNTPPGTTTPPPERYVPQQPLPPVHTPSELPTPTYPLPPTPLPGPSNVPPVVNTPQGPLFNNGPVGIPGGLGTATNPAVPGQSIIVPNGNGTSTVIAPDGSTQVIPTPK